MTIDALTNRRPTASHQSGTHYALVLCKRVDGAVPEQRMRRNCRRRYRRRFRCVLCHRHMRARRPPPPQGWNDVAV